MRMLQNTLRVPTLSVNRLVRSILYPLSPLLGKLRSILGLNIGLTVFLFHEVTDDPSIFQIQSGMWTSCANFQKQISWISSNFEVIDIQNVKKYDLLAGNFALITFDDAWIGMASAIRMLSEKNNLPSVLFTNMATVESGFDFSALEAFLGSKELANAAIKNQKYPKNASSFSAFQGQTMNERDIKEIAVLSKVTIGSHLYNHRRAADLSPDEFNLECLRNSDAIRKLGLPNPRYFAFPHGSPERDFTSTHVTLLSAFKFELIFSTQSQRLNGSIGNGYIPRIHFSPNDQRASDFWWATYKNQLLNRS